MKTVLKIDHLVPGLNGKGGLIREHFTTAKKKKEAYLWTFLSQTKNRHLGRVRITYNRYCVTPMDWDNACASFKHLGDALVRAKIIRDDNSRIVLEFIPKQIQIGSKRDQRCEIIIEDIDTSTGEIKE